MQQNRPIIKPLADMIKAYVYTNRHLLKDGYLFPFYTSRKKPYMDTKTAEACFSKMRKIIGKDHINFLDKYEIHAENGKVINRYRISFHSLRRWFETHLLHEDVSVYAIKEIMNYADYEPLNCYLNRFEIIDKEPEILNKAFASVFQSLNKDG
jgi:integrase